MSPLKKAQKRLALFMDKENASLADCAKILLIDESNLSCFMEQTAAFSRYTETVLKCFGSDNNKRNLAKLQDIQGSQANPRFKGAAEKKYVQGLPAKAIHALDEFMKRHGFKAEKASIELGWAKGNAYQVKWLHRKNELGKRAAIGILDAIDNYETSTKNNISTVAPATSSANLSGITKDDITSDRQARDKSNSSTFEEAEDPTPTSDDMRELLSTHFETQTGYSIREIQDAADEIDLILSAKRVGATVRITADLSCAGGV